MPARLEAGKPLILNEEDIMRCGMIPNNQKTEAIRQYNAMKNRRDHRLNNPSEFSGIAVAPIWPTYDMPPHVLREVEKWSQSHCRWVE